MSRAAEPAISAAVPLDASGTTRPGSIVSLFARVQAIDAAQNAFSASNSTSLILVRCSNTTLAKVGGPVVKAADLKVGMAVVIRGRLETDGSVSASFLGTRIPTPGPSTKTTQPKEGKGPDSK